MKKILNVLMFMLSAFAVSTLAAQTKETRNSERNNFEASFGPLYGPRSLPAAMGSDVLLAKAQQSNVAELMQLVSLLRWNTIAINASGLDHTPVQAGETRVFGEQLGPHRSSRAMAIVHIAIFDAVNAIHRRYQSYSSIPVADPRTSMEAAIAQAAHDTLVAMYPSQAPSFDSKLSVDLSLIRPGFKKTLGIALGKSTAQAILATRAADGSNHTEMRMNETYIPGTGPGIWRQDPISLIPLALGARWSEVRPFVMTTADQFRLPPPPALNSPEYTAAFNEAKAYGGDGIITPTIRSAEQTHIGIFWAYDGTPSLCAPPRLYNQVTTQVALQQFTHPIELARLYALVNTAMADAGIAAWDSKYQYAYWRPIGGVRESDPGTGSSGLGDGNGDTVGDVNFMPLGAPASNLTGPNFTPPFPAYPSGHATFGGALFRTLERFYGHDDVPFMFISDEFNGVTVDNQGNTRPFMPRFFNSFSEASEENGQSRIYLGIHWAFDKTGGITQGNQIADYVFQNAFQPLP